MRARWLCSRACVCVQTRRAPPQSGLRDASAEMARETRRHSPQEGGEGAQGTLPPIQCAQRGACHALEPRDTWCKCAVKKKANPSVSLSTHTHTHTRSFKDFHTHHWQVYAPDTICKCPIKKQKKAPGREKTETAPRKNSLGPTIRWQDGRKGLQREGGPLTREGSAQWGSAQWAVASWAAGRALRAGGALEVRREESKVCRLGIIAAQRSPLRRTQQIGPGMLWNRTHTTSCKPRAGWCC